MDVFYVYTDLNTGTLTCNHKKDLSSLVAILYLVNHTEEDKAVDLLLSINISIFTRIIRQENFTIFVTQLARISKLFNINNMYILRFHCRAYLAPEPYF